MLGLLRRSAFLLGVVLLAAGPWAPTLYAQEASAVCERALSAAEDQYREAAYDEALRLVSACLNQRDRAPEQAISAYRLLALIHLKRDELDQARAAVVNLLGLDPNYEADPVTSPPAYVSLVAIVKRDLQRSAADSVRVAEDGPRRKPFFRRTSTWVTIGTVVGGGVIGYVALQGGGDSGGGGAQPLPIPPGNPPPP
jgi:hypothetical protein